MISSLIEFSFWQSANEACAHYVMVSNIQWKPFWLVTQLEPQNDWTGWQNGVNYDVFAPAPFCTCYQFSRPWILVREKMLFAVFWKRGEKEKKKRREREEKWQEAGIEPTAAAPCQPTRLDVSPLRPLGPVLFLFSSSSLSLLFFKSLYFSSLHENHFAVFSEFRQWVCYTLCIHAERGTSYVSIDQLYPASSCRRGKVFLEKDEKTQLRGFPCVPEKFSAP